MCACSLLPRLANTTAVTLVAHARELQKPSNTGRVALRMLENSRSIVRGAADAEQSRQAEAALDAVDPDVALLLFPRQDARPLAEVLAELPPERRELIVPDGTWSQTRRLVRRHPALQRLRAVVLDASTTEYLLRRGTVPGHLCTLEAVAAALAVVEGPALSRSLLHGFRHWQRAALAVRGRLRLLDQQPLDPEARL